MAARRSPGVPLVLAVPLVAAGLVALVGCAPSPPDYTALLSRTPTATTTSAADEPPIPFAEYLRHSGVGAAPVDPDTLPDLRVTIPTPPGWAPVRNPDQAPGVRTLAKNGDYPTATLLTFRLDGDLDTAEAIAHADGDAEMSDDFTKLNGAKTSFKGFPSSMIEGSYTLSGQRMQSYNRVVIATGRPVRANIPGQRYLVQLTITGFADQARAEGPDVEAILRGFDVAAR